MIFLNVFIVLTFTLCAFGAKQGNETGIPVEYWHTCQFLNHYGYPCETYEVTTKDGYILVLHRIPHGKKSNITHPTNGAKKPVAYLQHGVMQSSTTWVINDPSKSLGYLLADRGYDVWMGNSRGNTYSFKHTFLKPHHELYWDFSFSEMAEYDLPASIDFVLEKTGEKQLYYIGHSQGTTIAFAGFSKDRELASKIKLFVALAPVAYLKFAKGLLKTLSNFSPIVRAILHMLGTKNFLPSSWMTRYFAKIICGKVVKRDVCASVLFLISGHDTHNIDLSRLPIYMSHTPAGTSVKDMMHFSQLIQSGKFCMYDYGWNGNMHRYKQPVPPSYFIGEMRVPIAMFTGELDWLSTIEDVSLNLKHQLPNIVYFHQTEFWNHLDFVWGATAKEVIYEKVFELMEG